MSEWPFVAAAYALAWAVLTVYGVRLLRIRGRARRDFDNVREGVTR